MQLPNEGKTPIARFKRESTLEGFSSTDEFKQIAFETVEEIQTNNQKNFSLESDGKIKINGNIKIVEISGVLQQRGGYSSYYTCRLYKNGTQINSLRLYGNTGFQTLLVKTDIFQVEDGDVLHFEVSTNNTGNGVHFFEAIIKEVK